LIAPPQQKLGGIVGSLVRHNALITIVVQLLAEAAMYFCAVVLGVYVHRQFPPGIWTLHVYFPAFVFAALMVVVSALMGLYRADGPLASKGYFTKVVAAAAIGVPIAYLVFAAIPYGDLVQRAIGNVLLLTLAGGLFLRPFLSTLLRVGLFQYRLLVVGTGPEARTVEQALGQRGLSNAVVASFYPVNDIRDLGIDQARILSGTEPLDQVVARLRISEVIVAVREQRGGVLPLKELLSCRAKGVRVTGIAQFLERVVGQVPLETIKASSLIYGDGFHQGMVRASIKRLADIGASLLLLLFAGPVMLITALAIRLESGGPIIYRQERVGRGGKPFTLLKFRSMRTDAESDGLARWAQANDARVTRVGRFLRRTRIDELPQLINVMRGEMSFVGPRPERPTFVAELKEQIPFYDLRHSVKPGITGWAQVRYPYGASAEDAAKKLQFDLYYVKNNSPILDAVILLETARVVLFGEGVR
jgi:sugar transferase (PEP-CTERM system associated)